MILRIGCRRSGIKWDSSTPRSTGATHERFAPSSPAESPDKRFSYSPPARKYSVVLMVRPGRNREARARGIHCAIGPQGRVPAPQSEPRGSDWLESTLCLQRRHRKPPYIGESFVLRCSGSNVEAWHISSTRGVNVRPIEKRNTDYGGCEQSGHQEIGRAAAGGGPYVAET